ncbi:MAG: hypothetical protein M1540_04750 [Candidatus Bathyarchaeota archaeon]|nr:hypothetical protein [Candidatus Bathyarchaeota archaeon]
MNRKIIVLDIVVALLVSSVAAVLISGAFSPKNGEFYVGVTYGGDNVEDAKLLIDKVNSIK